MSQYISISLQDLLKIAQGSLFKSTQENPHFVGVAPLEFAAPNTISFLANIKYLDAAQTTKAGVVLCTEDAAKKLLQNNHSILIVCANPYAAFAKVSQTFFKPRHSFQGISQQAFIDKTAKVAQSATIFPNAYVAAHAVIGENTVIYPGCFVGEHVTIGNDCLLYPNVVVREGCNVGHRCLLNPGAVIGGEGFGFAPTLEENVKIPQIGGVQIADDVEIGANSTIDRGTIENTTVGRQTKIDNLVTVGHNSQIGEFCFLAGQTGVAGSAKIGNRVTTAGQVGISGHLSIGDNVIIGPKSGVTKNIPNGQTWLGIPARPYKEFVKWLAVLNRFVKKQG